jgi:hypothetical protein
LDKIVKPTLVILSTGAYLSLAVFGRGGITAFFSHPPLTALATVLFALSGVALLAGGI